MLKIIFDYSLAILILPLLLPIMLIVAILIKLDSKGPALFLQDRYGKDMKIFKIYKFRTMYVDMKLANGQFISSGKRDPRITKIGHVLRKTRLDELPQIFNILKGEMSFVGSRPQVKKYVDVFPERYKYILKMKPGITGLSTIKIHGAEDELMARAEDPEAAYIAKILPPKLKYNEFYVEHYSFCFDLKILVLTAMKFVKAS